MDFAVLVPSFADVAVTVTGMEEATVLGAVKVTAVLVAALRLPQEETEQERVNFTPELEESLVTVAVSVVAWAWSSDIVAGVIVTRTPLLWLLPPQAPNVIANNNIARI
jgi:hypothetical protein